VTRRQLCCKRRAHADAHAETTDHPLPGLRNACPRAQPAARVGVRVWAAGQHTPFCTRFPHTCHTPVSAVQTPPRPYIRTPAVLGVAALQESSCHCQMSCCRRNPRELVPHHQHITVVPHHQHSTAWLTSGGPSWATLLRCECAPLRCVRGASQAASSNSSSCLHGHLAAPASGHLGPAHTATQTRRRVCAAADAACRA
jgi:hypothetical protein